MLRRAACGAALALTLTAPSALAADWTPASGVAAGDNGSLALAPGGNLAVSYSRPQPGPDEPRIATRVAGGAFTDRTTHGGTGAPYGLDTRADGTVVGHVLGDEGRIFAASRPLGGVFGPEAPLTPAESELSAYSLDFSPGGAHALAWNDQGQTFLQVRFPDTSRDVPVAEGTGFGAPLVSVADDGQAVAISWTNGGFTHRVRSAGKNGTWADALPVAGTNPRVAMNARGDALLTWNEGQQVKAAYRPAGGVFGASVEIVRAPSPFDQPVPVVDPDGEGTVVSLRESTRTQGQALVAARVSDGGVGFVHLVDTEQDGGDRPTVPRAVVDADDRLWVAWSRSGDDDVRDLYVSRQDLGSGDFAAPRRLSSLEKGVNPFGVQLAVDDRGGAAVSWSTDEAAPEILVAEYTDRRPGGGGGGGGVPGPGPAPAPQPGPAPTPTPPAGTPRGKVTSPVQALSRLAVKRSGAKAAVSFTLRTAGPVSLAVEKAATGRRAGAKCVRPTARNRRKASCSRWLPTARKLAVRGAAGANAATLALRGMAPGRYRVVAKAGTATAAATFTVPRKRTRR